MNMGPRMAIDHDVVVLAVSPRMVYALIEAGELTPVRLPGSGHKRSAVRIARVDLLSFVARLRGRNA
jgi:hypothetical protein